VKVNEDENPWEVLGVQPGASEEEVRRAYERLSVTLAPGSLALYSLAEIEDQRALQRKLRAAYLTLMRAFGWEVPVTAQGEGLTAAPDVPPPAADAPSAAAGEAAPSSETEFTGAVLRKVRQGLGLSLPEIAARTRIRPRQLESIEEERFEALPERVFVRGFVMAYARELHLDPERVWATYEKRWHGAGPRE
jgi:flagellar biosynthesis protein FlhG